MMHGIDNYLVDAPFSLIISIILLFGIINLGIFFQKIVLNKIGIENYTDYYYYSPISGTYLLILLLYPLLIFGLSNLLFFKLISIILLFLGILLILKYYKYFTKNFIYIKKYLLNNLIICLGFFALFLFAASPITHSDSLGYHALGAIDILNSGSFNFDILPFSLKLTGPGEIIIALGFALGAEQLGALIQFSSLMALMPLFTKIKIEKNLKSFFIYIILFTPITIFLVSSPKPQLMSAIATLLIFAYLFQNFNKKKSNLFIATSIIIIILTINVLIKFSFIISSSILWLILIYRSFFVKNFLQVISITIISFIIFVFPLFILKHINFDTNILQFFISPLPLNIYGYDMLQNLVSPNYASIFSLFVPESLGHISTIYGPSLLLIFFIKIQSVKKNKIFFSAVLIFFIIHYNIGSNLNRFFYEGYIWFIYLISNNNFKNNILFKFLFKYLKLQTILLLIIASSLGSQLFVGSLTQNMHDKVMKHNANGYILNKWVNTIIPDDDVAITFSRSVSLNTFKAYFSDFTWYVDFNDERSKIYADFLKSKKVKWIIFYGKKLNTKPFEKCIGEERVFEKNVGRKVGRNPFNKFYKYHGWIYEFKYDLLPDCLVR